MAKDQRTNFQRHDDEIRDLKARMDALEHPAHPEHPAKPAKADKPREFDAHITEVDEQPAHTKTEK
jgi:hypothetical protein